MPAIGRWLGAGTPSSRASPLPHKPAWRERSDRWRVKAPSPAGGRLGWGPAHRSLQTTAAPPPLPSPSGGGSQNPATDAGADATSAASAIPRPGSPLFVVAGVAAIGRWLGAGTPPSRASPLPHKPAWRERSDRWRVKAPSPAGGRLGWGPAHRSLQTTAAPPPLPSPSGGGSQNPATDAGADATSAASAIPRPGSPLFVVAGLPAIGRWLGAGTPPSRASPLPQGWSSAAPRQPQRRHILPL